jgi:GDP-L-fucose synthase
MAPAKPFSDYYRDKKVLVTGGAGFIGSHLVEMLVKLGAQVTVPVRPSTQRMFLDKVKQDIAIVTADLFEPRSIAAVMRGQTIVMHLAAAKGGGIVHSMAHHGSLFRDNMLSSINVLDAARDAAVQRLLVVSSACVYPRDATIPTPEDEGFKDVPEPTNAGYGWSKRMAEYLAAAYSDEYGMNIGIARPFNAYGPRDDFFRPTNHVIPGLITRLFNGENPLTVWGSGKQTRSFLYVEDFARGLLYTCAAEHVRGPLNLGSDEEITIADLATLVAEISGLAVPIVLDPGKPDGQPRRACDTHLAKATLAFQAEVPLRQGLAHTIAWYTRERQVRQT